MHIMLDLLLPTYARNRLSLCIYADMYELTRMIELQAFWNIYICVYIYIQRAACRQIKATVVTQIIVQFINICVIC